MILVIGAGSRTGQELLRLLSGGGEPVRTLVRPGGTTAGPDTVIGDLADPGSLDHAMKGAEKVFLLSSAAPGELAWHRNAIEAAGRAGVRLLVRSSILGADPASPARFLADHGQADDYVRASGLTYTILRPNFYLHNVTALWPPTLSEDDSYYAPAGDARISMTDARDVAAVAAAALTGQDQAGAEQDQAGAEQGQAGAEQGQAGTEYDITGPEALSHAEACARLGAALGRVVRYVPVDDTSARAGMLGAGLGEWLADALVELYQDYRRSGHDGYAAQVTDAVQAVTGSPPRSLDQALADELGHPDHTP